MNIYSNSQTLDTINLTLNVRLVGDIGQTSSNVRITVTIITPPTSFSQWRRSIDVT